MASGHVNQIGRTHGCTDQACKRENTPCQLGAVHTWHLADLWSIECPFSGGGFNGSTQHPFILSWHVGTVCIQRTCKDVVHAKAEAELRKRWKSGQCGRTSPESQETAAMSKILALNGRIVPAPCHRAPSE
jgi:hypothetical protein